jgi:AcrR family transcriptional regulator
VRVKTDERRRLILDAAMELFREVGFARASMQAISTRVGGSKQTLYSYFSSKEELFASAMVAALEKRGYEVLELVDPATDDVGQMLERFGEAYLGFLTSPDRIANNRVAIGSAGTTTLGAVLYEMGPRRLWTETAKRLAPLIDRGTITAPSAELAALHLQALLEAGIYEARLFGAEPPNSGRESVRIAVATFLRLYGPRTNGSPCDLSTQR